jgi:excisionase family DNA binding protein
MTAPPTSPLAALLDMVRTAAREGAEEALASHAPTTPAPSGSLIDKRSLAHALGVSPATVDRLCRDGRVPFVRVGDVRRFDLAAVRTALGETSATKSSAPPTSALRQAGVAGVRLLSRRPR